ncbi:vomeronasal type-2 receptor 26-like [Latimeria chalumnae]|uniref:vomeronasal type-2 receptor 26-like n=1 Tax=Latimeria chalumnae TaxID=7897 RepID=UPI00313CC0E7
MSQHRSLGTISEAEMMELPGDLWLQCPWVFQDERGQWWAAYLDRISPASSVSILSNKQEFPSFFRTMPSDEFQSMGFARLVLHFGWKWIGLLADDSEYGQQGIQIVPRSVCSESCPLGYRKATNPGQPICCFDCIPCSTGEIANQTDATECLKCPDDQWSNELQHECIPKTIEFLAYEDALGAALATLSILCALASTNVLCIFIKYRSTPIVKANNRELSYILLLALVLCFLTSLVFIGQPKTWSCMLRQAAFGIIFALSVSCVLAKTIMVVIAFNATKPNSNLNKWVGPKLLNCIVLGCTVIQIIICIIWLASAPPFPTENTKSEIGMIIIECNEGSTTAFWCVLGYMGLLAIVSFIVAFLARNLPDSFNEAKFITFSMLVFVSVWLAFIPAYLSTKGKYMVAVEIFAILASSAGLLACIFFPKCYIILLRPDMNTRESVMGKGKLITKNVT